MKEGIVNDAFHAKTKALVLSAIALLISCIQKGEEIPLQISETYKVTEPGGWSMEYEDKPDYDIFILHSRKNHGETVDLSWLDSIDPEIEQRLLPMERTILAALRSYRTIFVTNPTTTHRAPPRS